MPASLRSVRGIRAAARVATIACGLALAFGAAAQTPPAAPAPQAGPMLAHFGPPPGGPMADGVPPFLRGIELTEAQRDKIFALTHAQAPALREQFKALDKAQRELRALAFGAYDEAKARSLADTAGRAQAELIFTRARADAQILQLLTPAQRKQLDEHPAGLQDQGHDRGEGPDQGPERHPPMAPRT